MTSVPASDPEGALPGPAQFLRADRPVIAPGCYDVVSAKALASAGIGCGYLTPFGFRASDAARQPPRPDPWQRLLLRAADILAAAPLALIIDAHTGLEGDRPVAARTADVLAVGASAVVFEDRPGFGSTRALLPVEVMRQHIETARSIAGDGMLIIARTDAVRESLTEAAGRCTRYLEAGADLVMPLMTPYLAHPVSDEGRARLETAHDLLLDHLPARRVVVHSPNGQHLTVDSARRRGFGIYLMPQLLIGAAVGAMLDAAAAVEKPVHEQRAAIEPTRLAAILGVDQWLKARW